MAAASQVDPIAPHSTPNQGFMAVVARNSAFVLGSQVLIKIVAFAFNVYVVRRLGAEHFGQYATVMAYVAVFGIFTDLGIAPYSVREMTEDRSRTAWILPSSIAIRVILSLSVACIAPLSALWLGKNDYFVLGILIASAGQLVWAFQGPLASALIARERLDYSATFALVERLVFWAWGTLALVSGKGFIGLIVASLVGVGARAVLSGWVLFRRLGVGHLELPVRRWPALLRSALPFGISGIAFVLRRRFDTLLLSFVLTDQVVGWYNVPITLIGMLLLLAVSVGQSMYPSMVRAYKTDLDALHRLVRRAIRYLLIISLPITVGGVILADKIVVTLYGEEFINSVRILQIILWALPSLFLLELLGRLANTLHRERRLARITIINTGITIALNLALVPTLGVIGAALALVGGRTINLVQNWLLIGHDHLVGNRWGSLLRTALAAGLMGVAVFFLSEFHLVVSIGVGALLYGVLLIGLGAVERQEIHHLVQMIPGRRKARLAAKGVRK